MFETLALGELWKRFRKPLLIGLAFALALIIVWRLLIAFGDARYKQGISDNELAWRIAENKLHEREAAAKTAADKAAASRNSAHADAVAEEKGRLNDAMREGYSPIDVLFGHADELLDDKAGSRQPSGSR